MVKALVPAQGATLSMLYDAYAREAKVDPSSFLLVYQLPDSGMHLLAREDPAAKTLLHAHYRSAMLRFLVWTIPAGSPSSSSAGPPSSSSAGPPSSSSAGPPSSSSAGSPSSSSAGPPSSSSADPIPAADVVFRVNGRTVLPGKLPYPLAGAHPILTAYVTACDGSEDFDFAVYDFAFLHDGKQVGDNLCEVRPLWVAARRAPGLVVDVLIAETSSLREFAVRVRGRHKVNEDVPLTRVPTLDKLEAWFGGVAPFAVRKESDGTRSIRCLRSDADYDTAVRDAKAGGKQLLETLGVNRFSAVNMLSHEVGVLATMNALNPKLRMYEEFTLRGRPSLQTFCSLLRDAFWAAEGSGVSVHHGKDKQPITTDEQFAAAVAKEPHGFTADFAQLPYGCSVLVRLHGKAHCDLEGTTAPLFWGAETSLPRTLDWLARKGGEVAVMLLYCDGKGAEVVTTSARLDALLQACKPRPEFHAVAAGQGGEGCACGVVPKLCRALMGPATTVRPDFSKDVLDWLGPSVQPCCVPHPFKVVPTLTGWAVQNASWYEWKASDQVAVCLLDSSSEKVVSRIPLTCSPGACFTFLGPCASFPLADLRVCLSVGDHLLRDGGVVPLPPLPQTSLRAALAAQCQSVAAWGGRRLVSTVMSRFVESHFSASYAAVPFVRALLPALEEVARFDIPALCVDFGFQATKLPSGTGVSLTPTGFLRRLHPAWVVHSDGVAARAALDLVLFIGENLTGSVHLEISGVRVSAVVDLSADLLPYSPPAATARPASAASVPQEAPLALARLLDRDCDNFLYAFGAGPRGHPGSWELSALLQAFWDADQDGRIRLAAQPAVVAAFPTLAAFACLPDQALAQCLPYHCTVSSQRDSMVNVTNSGMMDLPPTAVLVRKTTAENGVEAACGYELVGGRKAGEIWPSPAALAKAGTWLELLSGPGGFPLGHRPVYQ